MIPDAAHVRVRVCERQAPGTALDWGTLGGAACYIRRPHPRAGETRSDDMPAGVGYGYQGRLASLSGLW